MAGTLVAMSGDAAGAAGRTSGPPACCSTSGMPNVADRFSSVSTWSSSPAATTFAVAQQQDVGEPGRDLLDVVADQHRGR